MPSTASDRLIWNLPPLTSAWTWDNTEHGDPRVMNYIDEPVSDRGQQKVIKECPGCGRVVRMVMGMCPLCGHDEADPEHPGVHPAFDVSRVANGYDNWQDPRQPFADQSGALHEQCPQCGELMDHDQCPMCGYRKALQPEQLLNHQPRGPQDQAGTWTFPEHWGKTADAWQPEGWDLPEHRPEVPEPAYKQWHEQFGKGFTQEDAQYEPDPEWTQHLNFATPGDRFLHQPMVEDYDPVTLEERPSIPHPHIKPYEVMYKKPDANYTGAHWVMTPQGETQWVFRDSLMPLPHADSWNIPGHPDEQERTGSVEGNVWKISGPVQWMQNFVHPPFVPQPEDMSGLAQHCYFHPDRPAVSHAGGAAMCQDCAERYVAAGGKISKSQVEAEQPSVTHIRT